jgi:hypothetical protein
MPYLLHGSATWSYYVMPYLLLGFPIPAIFPPLPHALYHLELIHMRRAYERNEPQCYNRNSKRLAALPLEDSLQLSYRGLTCSGCHSKPASCYIHYSWTVCYVTRRQRVQNVCGAGD